MADVKPLVIAIDGPAGSGKSTVTKRIAARLGLLYLDTGAMYRAATVGLLNSGVDVDSEAAVADYVCARQVSFSEQGQVCLDGHVMPEADIRSPATTAEIWRVANNKACRLHLVALQQGIVAGRSATLEGRDTTTVICPDADLKIYLAASVEERAKRRRRDWGADAPALAQIMADIQKRDERDSQRATGALQQASDAVMVVTDGLGPDEVEARILALAVQRRPLLLESKVLDQVLVGRSRDPGYVKVAQGSISDPPAPWQLGLTNPSADRLPGRTTAFARNHGGRQAGVLCQGRAVICLAGTDKRPGQVVALPMLPQTWYVLEPEVWHAVVQQPGTIAAWAEASGMTEDRAELDAVQQAVMAQYLQVYLPV